MFKSTITLKNGAKAEVECETADQLGKIIASYDAPLVTTPVSVKVTVPRKYTKRVQTKGHWSESEILLLVRNLQESGPDYNKMKDAVKKTVAELNGAKTRASVAIMASRLAEYLFESSTQKYSLSARAVRILKRAGIKKGKKTISGYKAQKGWRGRPWTERDLAEMGKIILSNIHADGGISRKVISYMKKNGDVPVRSKNTFYSMTCDIKNYLRTGDKNRVNKKTRDALNNAGIYPVGDQNRMLVEA